MRRIETIARNGRCLLVALTCAALVVWNVAPSTSHVPKIVKTLQEHAEMIAEHGHSHGLAEDLLWAMHGHGHDVADHEHGHAALLSSRSTETLDETRAARRGHARSNWSSPLFLLERPPRA